MTSPPLAPLLTMSEGHLGVDDHPDYAYGACEAVCAELRAQRAALAQERAKVATLEAERDLWREQFETIRVDQGWTPSEQASEIRRLTSVLSDAAAAYSKACQRADAAEAALTSARLAREEAEAIHKTTHTAWCITSSRLEEVVSLYEKEKDRALAAEAEARTLREAATIVLRGFDEGMFVRNTFGDDDVIWAMKFVPYLAALAQLKAALTPPAGEEQT